MTPRIVVPEEPTRIDEPVRVEMAGFTPGGEVALSAETTDEAGVSWASHAVFVSDEDGRVDLATSAAVRGDWSGADAMGFVWSMRPPAAEPPRRFHQDRLDDITVRLRAHAGDGSEARAELARRSVDEGVSRTDVREGGLVASIFEPADRRGHTAVLVLGGSMGGLEAARAAVLASRGYAAMALAYFGLPGLPDSLVGIELEYFERAIRFMEETGLSSPDRLVLMGTSRGGELALLLASRMAGVGGVVAYVPSAVVHAGIPAGGDRRRIEEAGEASARPAAWTVAGEGLTPAPVTFERVDFGAPPVRFLPGFAGGLEDRAGIEAARIPLQDVTAPVLMFSGGDDQVWPSTAFARLAEEALTSSRQVEHVVYPGAGHNIGHPYLPATAHTVVHPISGLDFAFGGSDAADARANEESWSRVLAFLARI